MVAGASSPCNASDFALISLKISNGGFVKKLTAISLIVFSAFVSFSAQAATFNVSTGPDFQIALDAAAINGEDDSIILSAGTYNSAEQSDCFSYLSTQQNSLSVQGAGPQTILTGSETTPVLCFQTSSGQDSGILLSLSQMTIQDGVAVDPGAGARFSVHAASVSVQDVIFQNNQFTDDSDEGGGLSIRTKTQGASTIATTISVQNCSFISNTSAGGAGGLFISYPEDAATITLANNLVNGNSTASGSVGGASIIVGQGVVTVSSNTFESNTVEDEGLGGGFGVQTQGGIVSMNGNWISGNTAKAAGGAIFFGIDAQLTMTNNVIVNNTATSDMEGSGIAGAGFLIIQEGENTANIVNNTFTGNQANQAAGAGLVIGLSGSTGSQSQIANNILYGNASPENQGQDLLIFAENDTEVGEFSLIANDYLSFASLCSACEINVASTNIQTDPLFVNASAGNYHLSDSSPCIDTGDNSVPGYPSNDYDGTARSGLADMGAFVATVVPVGTLTGDGCSLSKRPSANSICFSFVLFIPVILSALFKKQHCASVKEGS